MYAAISSHKTTFWLELFKHLDQFMIISAIRCVKHATLTYSQIVLYVNGNNMVVRHFEDEGYIR
jgi:hypothetical protein